MPETGLASPAPGMSTAPSAGGQPQLLREEGYRMNQAALGHSGAFRSCPLLVRFAKEVKKKHLCC